MLVLGNYGFWDYDSLGLWFLGIMVLWDYGFRDYVSLDSWGLGFFGIMVLRDNVSWDRFLLESMVRWDYGT